jgi:hypothetical protein
VNGLILTDRVPAHAEHFLALEGESDDLQEEFHLARRIIQGQSAAYLLATIGSRSLSDELEETATRISEWVRELFDAVSAKAAGNVLARRMLPVVAELGGAQRELLPFLAGVPSERAADPLALVRRAHDRLETVFAHTPLGSTPTSNGCALEIDHLVATRSN